MPEPDKKIIPPAGDPPSPPPEKKDAPPAGDPPPPPPPVKKDDALPADPPAGDPPDTGSLLDDSEKGKDKKEAAPAATDEKTLSAFVDGITVDLGNGPDGKPLQMDKAALKAVAPALLKYGVTPVATSEIVKAMSDYQLNQAQEMAAMERTALIEMKKATAKELGKDLPQFISEARRGGKYVFGDVWPELASIAAFGVDVRIIKALSAIGRSVKDDDGADGGDAGKEKEKGFSANGWIKDSNKQK